MTLFLHFLIDFFHHLLLDDLILLFLMNWKLRFALSNLSLLKINELNLVKEIQPKDIRIFQSKIP